MKIIVLARLGSSTSILLNWLVREGYTDLDVVLEAPPERLRKLRQRARRLGWMHALGQAAFMAGVMPVLRRQVVARRQQLLTDHDLDENMPPIERMIMVETINDPVVVDHLRQGGPKVVLVNGTRIIRPPVLKATSSPFINTHVGITPDYRGVHGGYWALWNNEPEKFGVTLHLVDEGVDTGRILAQAATLPTVNDNLVSYALLQQIAAFDELKKLLKAIEKGRRPSPQAPDHREGTQWTHPTLLQYAIGRLRGVR